MAFLSNTGRVRVRTRRLLLHGRVWSRTRLLHLRDRSRSLHSFFKSLISRTVSPTHTPHMTPSKWQSSLMVDSALEMCLFLPIFVHLGTPVGARAPGTYLLVYWVQPAHVGLWVRRLVFSNIDIDIHLEHHSFRFKCYKRAFKLWSNKLH